MPGGMEEWGEAWEEESNGEGQDTAKGFPLSGDSLLRTVVTGSMET